MTQGTTTPVVVDAEEIERVSPVSTVIHNETSRPSHSVPVQKRESVSGTCSDIVLASVPPAGSGGGEGGYYLDSSSSRTRKCVRRIYPSTESVCFSFIIVFYFMLLLFLLFLSLSLSWYGSGFLRAVSGIGDSG